MIIAYTYHTTLYIIIIVIIKITDFEGCLLVTNTIIKMDEFGNSASATTSVKHCLMRPEATWTVLIKPP